MRFLTSLALITISYQSLQAEGSAYSGTCSRMYLLQIEGKRTIMIIYIPDQRNFYKMSLIREEAVFRSMDGTTLRGWLYS
jgi:hypothetical protein